MINATEISTLILFNGMTVVLVRSVDEIQKEKEKKEYVK